MATPHSFKSFEHINKSGPVSHVLRKCVASILPFLLMFGPSAHLIIQTGGFEVDGTVVTERRRSVLTFFVSTITNILSLDAQSTMHSGTCTRKMVKSATAMSTDTFGGTSLIPFASIRCPRQATDSVGSE